MRLLDGKPWIHSSDTRVADTLESMGFEGPQKKAERAEKRAQYEGALQAMKVIQANPDSFGRRI